MRPDVLAKELRQEPVDQPARLILRPDGNLRVGGGL
jgi:hypothetical protein